MPQKQSLTQQTEDVEISEKTEGIADSSARHKVLIIEDDEMICDMYKLRFGAENWEVICAAKGEEGLKMAKEEKPEVILLDIILPGLDGFSILEKLKTDEATKNVPVVLLTNLGQEEDIKKGNSLGASDYLVKSGVTPKQVLEKVKGALGGN